MIHLVGSIDPDSNEFSEHHFSGLDQVIRLVVSADLEPNHLKSVFLKVSVYIFSIEALALSYSSYRIVSLVSIGGIWRFGVDKKDFNVDNRVWNHAFLIEGKLYQV